MSGVAVIDCKRALSNIGMIISKLKLGFVITIGINREFGVGRGLVIIARGSSYRWGETTLRKFYKKVAKLYNSWVSGVPKFHRCDMCGKRFPATQIGRIQIIKRLPKGKVEFWVCKNCSSKFKERVKPLIPHIEWEPKNKPEG